jgi:hypothetical protein
MLLFISRLGLRSQYSSDAASVNNRIDEGTVGQFRLCYTYLTVSPVHRHGHMRSSTKHHSCHRAPSIQGDDDGRYRIQLSQVQYTRTG